MTRCRRHKRVLQQRVTPQGFCLGTTQAIQAHANIPQTLNNINKLASPVFRSCSSYSKTQVFDTLSRHSLRIILLAFLTRRSQNLWFSLHKHDSMPTSWRDFSSNPIDTVYTLHRSDPQQRPASIQQPWLALPPSTGKPAVHYAHSHFSMPFIPTLLTPNQGRRHLPIHRSHPPPRNDHLRSRHRRHRHPQSHAH